MTAQIQLLGQSGVRMRFDNTVVFVDPYLSDYVYNVEQSEDLRRVPAIPLDPSAVSDADFVFSTHEHMDHCDPETLAPLLRASPGAQVIAPASCGGILRTLGLDASRQRVASRASVELRPGLEVQAVPAAHPDVAYDDSGQLRFVGYVFTHEGRRYYHAGDTSVHEELIEAVQAIGPIDVAFLPVNETNYYRNRRGIIGNMSVREAFQLAEDLNVRHLVPVHWDMFAPNSVYPEEIELIYRLMKPPFELHMNVVEL